MRTLRRLCALIAAALAVSAEAADKSHPNVLFIVVDDLNTDLGCYGNRDVRSPNIDRLAAHGVRFDRAHCQYPLCNPSRVSFLSGRRPETSGVYVLNTSARTALPDAILLPQFFRQQGYYAAGAGKVFHSARMSDAASWDRYEDGEGEDAQEKAAIKSRYGGGDGRPAWHVLDSDGSKTRDGLNSATIRSLLLEKVAAKQSFFLAAGFHKPHLPWTAPKRFFDLYPTQGIEPAPEPALRNIPPLALQTELSGFEQPSSRALAIRGYYACISFTDSLIGRLLDELDRLDLWKTTLVVLLGDNGFHLGDHGGLWAKLSAFDASTRVPLIIAGAGLPAGRSISAPVELLDVYPTLADYAGFKAPQGLEGRSLRPLIEGTERGEQRIARSLVFHYDVTGKRDLAGRTVIAPNWRYTEWADGKFGRELYLRRDDPQEYHNRAEEPEQAEIMATAAKALRATPAPKPAPANRPRALAPGDNKQ
jgi:uncharacterized sulfatase